MHREPLRLLLHRYGAAHPEEMDLVRRFLAFVQGHDDCLERSCVPGHITASCWILSPDREARLMTHHRKLGRWLQLGGHVDGEAEVAQAALREAQEESGMADFSFLQDLPFDLDIHPIPARGREPEHLHLDLRFLLQAAAGQQLQISDESLDLRWVPVGALDAHTEEESVLRLERKTQAWLAQAD